MEQAQREGEARLSEAEATHAAEVVEARGKALEQVPERLLHECGVGFTVQQFRVPEAVGPVGLRV